MTPWEFRMIEKEVRKTNGDTIDDRADRMHFGHRRLHHLAVELLRVANASGMNREAGTWSKFGWAQCFPFTLVASPIPRVRCYGRLYQKLVWWTFSPSIEMIGEARQFEWIVTESITYSLTEPVACSWFQSGLVPNKERHFVPRVLIFKSSGAILESSFPWHFLCPLQPWEVKITRRHIHCAIANALYTFIASAKR